MTLTPEIQELLVTFGPILLGVVGTVLTGTFGVLMALGRYAWTSHQRRMLLMADALESLAKSVSHAEAANKEDHGKVWQAIQGLRAELQLSNRNTDTVKAGLLKVEGMLESHRGTLYTHIEKLGILDGKLTKLFTFVDAPRRATDI